MLSKLKGNDIWSGDTLEFHVMNDVESEEFLAFYRTRIQNIIDKPVVPIGILPSGDIVIDVEGKVFVIDHDTLEEWESRVSTESLVQALFMARKNIEEWIFGADGPYDLVAS